MNSLPYTGCAGRVALPGWLPRLAAFVALAWACGELGGALLDSNLLFHGCSRWARLADAAREGSRLDALFWALAASVAAWRIRGWRRSAAAAESARPQYAGSEHAGPESEATEHGSAGAGESLSQAARAQLSEDADAASAWVEAWQLFWQSSVLLALAYAPGPVIAAALLYAAWRGWRGAANLYRRTAWERAARRTAAAGARHAGGGWAEGAGGKIEGAGLWLAIAPVRALFQAVRIAVRLPLLAERFVLSWLILPPRLIWFALKRLRFMWGFAARALRDALIIPVLWCVAFAAAAGTAFF